MKFIIILISLLSFVQASDYKYCGDRIALLSMNRDKANTISFACGECKQYGQFAYSEAKTEQDLLNNCKAYAQKARSPKNMCLDICLGVNGYSLKN